LSGSTQSFTPSEVEQINLSVGTGHHAGLQRSPSRLEQMRNSYLTYSQDNLAIDMDPSVSYFVPTAPVSRGIQREDSLISIKCGEGEDFVSQSHTRTLITSVSDKPTSTTQISDKRLSIEELRNQVWIYSHKVSGIQSESHALEFEGEIHEKQCSPIISRGRGRLLTAIRSATAFNRERDNWPGRRRPEVLTEKSYCARRLHDFFEKRKLPQPDFLEEKLIRHVDASGYM
jgi:hypothetical protein